MIRFIVMKRAIVILIVVLIAIGGLFFLRRYEDNWICQNGTWVKHGKPNFLQPSDPCPSNNLTVTPHDNNTKKAIVYFSVIKSMSDYDCSEVYGVERTVSKNAGYAEILKELFKGPTKKESNEQFSSFFAKETEDILINVKVEGNTAYVNLKDFRKLLPSANTSCGSMAFMSQIEETLKHDNEIDKVIYAIEGNPETFYEWIQLGCSAENNMCDPAPFE